MTKTVPELRREIASLRRRLTKAENERDRLRADLDRKTDQLRSISWSYLPRGYGATFD